MKGAFFALAAALLAGCGNGGTHAGMADQFAPRDTNWMADLSITTGDTVVRLCESGKRYHLTGPAMDTIADRYRYTNTRKGQWMKLWWSGHLGTVVNGTLTDSVMFAMRFQHLDASLHCDPIPDARIAGSYVLDYPDPMHPRTIRLDLFTDGWAVMNTDLHDGRIPMEEDGRWGVNAENMVNVKWPLRDQTMTYEWRDGRLATAQTIRGSSIILQPGPPVARTSGAFGRTARWLATAASANGKAIAPEAIKPEMDMATLFPDVNARQRLDQAANDTLLLERLSLGGSWKQVSTVQDVVKLMRVRMRMD